MLETLRDMLGIEEADSRLDRKLEWIIDSTKARLSVLLGGIEFGTDLDYIIVEVSIVRFNRIGSEGTKSHAVEGESRSFLDSDFDEYKEDIQAYKESKNIDHAKGGILWA